MVAGDAEPRPRLRDTAGAEQKEHPVGRFLELKAGPGVCLRDGIGGGGGISGRVKG